MAGAVGRDVGPAVILDPEEKKSFKILIPRLTANPLKEIL